MKAIFDLAYDYVIQNESTKYTNDPKDSGGPTKFGITQKTYAEYVGREVTPFEIENLTDAVARQFYFEAFWVPLGCIGIDQPAVATCIFDTAILYGPWYAASTAQEVANKYGGVLKLDGKIGDKSRAAINQVSVGNFIISYYAKILERIDLVVARAPKNQRFEKGWKNRAGRLLKLLKPETEGLP